MREFLDCLARGTGIVAVLAATLGYVFREKWKQLLRRSLASDIERLKADLARQNAEHSAQLLPQLEQIKHDFQQKLEAYKVSLIAEAEAAKAASELRKTIALRYSEVEFERLVALESALGPAGTTVCALGTVDTAYKTVDDQTKALADMRALAAATAQAEMFLSNEDLQSITQLRGKLIGFVGKYVGSGKPSPGANSEEVLDIVTKSAATHRKLKAQIKQLGTLDK